jgi:hypothetical protein
VRDGACKIPPLMPRSLSSTDPASITISISVELVKDTVLLSLVDWLSSHPLSETCPATLQIMPSHLHASSTSNHHKMTNGTVERTRKCSMTPSTSDYRSWRACTLHSAAFPFPIHRYASRLNRSKRSPPHTTTPPHHHVGHRIQFLPPGWLEDAKNQGYTCIKTHLPAAAESVSRNNVLVVPYVASGYPCSLMQQRVSMYVCMYVCLCL